MDGHCYTIVGCALQEAQLQRQQYLTHCCRNWKAVHHMEAGPAVAASINCQPERVDKRAPLFRAGGLFFYASEATALVEVASPLQGQSSNGALLS